jgi:peptidoglycan/LPS O-acetylase OafA/YrhL
MSNYMIFAFMVPLLAGAVPNLLASFAGDKKRADSGSSAAAGLQLAAAATLTAGSLVNGALEIYGTTNRLMIFYPVAGLALLTAALAAYVLRDRRLSAKPSEQGRI